MVNQEIRQSPGTKPGFFYGYIVVIAAFVIMFVSWGSFQAFGVFLKPVLIDFDWTRATTSGAFSLAMIISGLLGIAMGGLTDRFGPRIVLSLCGFLLGLGYLLMSQISALWQLYLFYGILIGIGMGGPWVPLASTAARWFVKRRNIMTGLVVAGVGIGSLVIPPLAQQLISTYGWPIAYTILGSVLLVTVVSAAQFLRRDPSQKGLLPYGHNHAQEGGLSLETYSFSFREALNTRQFWLFSGIEFCIGFCIFTVTVHIAPHATELGFSPATAANILAAIGGISIFGNIVFGNIAEKIGNRRSFSIVFLLMSAALFWLMPSAKLWELLLFAGVFGFAFGGPGPIASPLAAELFGLKSHGLIYGVASLGFRLGASIGPFLAGYIFDTTSNYQIAFLVAAAVGIIGLILTTVLKPFRSPEVKT